MLQELSHLFRVEARACAAIAETHPVAAPYALEEAKRLRAISNTFVTIAHEHVRNAQRERAAELRARRAKGQRR
jgi:hypothetical protein